MRFRIKTAKHNIFSFEPRYYDPVKEEIEGKLKAAQDDVDHPESASRSSYISTAFKKRAKQNHKSNVMQLVIAMVLMGTFVAWLFYGNDVFYALLLISPGYFYFRIKKKTAKSAQ